MLGIQTGHTGSWGTKDYGVTEGIQALLGGGLALLQGKSPSIVTQMNTQQGGSNLWGPSNQAIVAQAAPTSGGQSTQLQSNPYQSVLGDNIGFGTIGGSTDTNGTNVVNTGGTTDGANWSSEFENALNQYYSPAYNRLDLLQQNYQQQYPIDVQNLETSFTDSNNQLDQRQREGTQGINTQKIETETGKESAISAARRIFNELSQRGISRFGAGSSTGNAFSEIIGKQVSQNIGSAEDTAGKAINKLDTELRNLGDFITNQKDVLMSKKKTALDQLKATLDTKLREIEANRGELDSAKAQQKMQQLVDARQRAYEIEDAATAYQRQLDLFDREKQSQLAQKYSVNNGISSQAISAFKALAPVVGTVAAAKLAGVDLSGVAGVMSSPTGSWRDLGDGRFINLETGEIQFAPDSFSTSSLQTQG